MCVPTKMPLHVETVCLLGRKDIKNPLITQ